MFKYSHIEDCNKEEAFVVFEGQSCFPEIYGPDGEQYLITVTYSKEEIGIIDLPEGWFEDDEFIYGEIDNNDEESKHILDNYQLYESCPSVLLRRGQTYFAIEDGKKLGMFQVEDLE